MLDLKHGCVLRTLIPKVAEGIFHVIAQFNETDEYVLYYHSGKKTLRVFRIIDGVMIANYLVPSNLTSLESTSDGNNVALGMVDGNVSILTIADPKKRRMGTYVRNLPSRQGLQAVITTKSKITNFIGTRIEVGKSCQKLLAKRSQPKNENEETESSAEEVPMDDDGEKDEMKDAEGLNKKHVSINE